MQVADADRHRQQHRVAGNAADQHRQHHAPGRVAGRIVRLFADVRAGVVAGEGPAREQEPYREIPARAVAGEQELRRLVRREEGERGH